MILHDFRCGSCNTEFEELVPSGEKKTTCSCGGEADRIMSAPNHCTTIVPTHKKSKKLKAGYVHSHADRPKTPGKIQVPVP